MRSMYSSTHVVEAKTKYEIQFLTPSDPEQRGAQLSLRIVGTDPRKLFDELERLGVCVSPLTRSVGLQ